MAGRPFRFLHAADLHLDSPFRGVGRAAPWLRPVLQDASLRAFERLLDLAVVESVDLVVWAGDVFDHTAPSLRAQFALRDGIARLGEHGIRVFWAHGNHDPFDTLAVDIGWPANLTRFPAGRVEHVVVPDPVDPAQPLCAVYGISYPEARVLESYAEQFVRDDEAPWAMAVLHGTVGAQPGHDNYAPAHLTDLTARGFDYWALGHIHHRAVLSESPWVVYPGNLQGRHPREEGPKGALVGHVDAWGRVRVAFHPLAPVGWRTLALDVTGEVYADRVEERLAAALADRTAVGGEDGTLVRIELTGRSPLAGLAPDDWLVMAERLSDSEPRPGFVFVESIVSHLARPVVADPPDGLLARALTEVDRLALPSDWKDIWPFADTWSPRLAQEMRQRVQDRLKETLGEELPAEEVR
ncbi:MAG: DNA repair exonuclease [Thermaerobacter sp.]|nr:DNA repair exonuclease [Thermaerobacter sp.]